MSTMNRAQLRPQYPVFSEHGYMPKPQQYGPPDMWPSGNNPGYNAYASAHGRHLAGVEDMNAEGIEVYPNELDQLSAADDTAGNGVFDPNDSHGNVHPDEGVFADHQSLPGYVDREVFYSPSEVSDLPGGGLTMYVPGGAVAFQQGQTETLRQQRLLWGIPDSVRPFEIESVRQQNTASAPTPVQSVGGTWSELSGTNQLLIAAGVGVVGGLAIFMWKRKAGR